MTARRKTSIVMSLALALPLSASRRVVGQVGGQSPDELARSHYEIGMKFLQTQQYGEALKDFQTVVDSFPTSRVAADALLEIARYQLDIARDPAAAQTTTDTIVRKYASTPAAAFAYVLSGRITLEKARGPADVETATANFGRVPVLYPEATPSHRRSTSGVKRSGW